MQKAKKYSDNSENVTKKGKNTTLDENNATESNEENIKHYLYLNDDGKVEYTYEDDDCKMTSTTYTGERVNGKIEGVFENAIYGKKKDK